MSTPGWWSDQPQNNCPERNIVGRGTRSPKNAFLFSGQFVSRNATQYKSADCLKTPFDLWHLNNSWYRKTMLANGQSMNSPSFYIFNIFLYISSLFTYFLENKCKKQQESFHYISDGGNSYFLLTFWSISKQPNKFLTKTFFDRPSHECPSTFLWQLSLRVSGFLVG